MSENNIHCYDFDGFRLDITNFQLLEDEESMLNALPMIHTDMEGMEKYELPNFVGYPFWFDINTAQNEEDVISTFKLQTNRKGDSILNSHGIPSKFPAVIGPQNGAFNYYFCGDFADNPVLEKLSYFKGISLISRLLYVVADESDRKAFFWNFYKPLMENIIKDYQNQENSELNSDSISFADPLDSINIEPDTVVSENIFEEEKTQNFDNIPLIKPPVEFNRNRFIA